MTPSSLKKMSGAQESKEGNYASLEKTPSGRFTICDLGLTLLPGSQIQRKDEKGSGTAAESGPKNPAKKCIGRSEQWKSFETGIQLKHPARETDFPNEAKSPSSSQYPDLESAKPSNATARINRERPFSQDFSAKDGSGVVQHNGNSIAAAPYDEQIMGTGEVRNANSCQNDDSSPRTVKRRKLGSRACNQMRDSKVNKGKEAAFETHYNRFYVHQHQDLSEINAVRSGKEKSSVATIGVPFGGPGGGLGSSKPESRPQIKHSPDSAPARSHQSTILVSEGIALHGNSASRSPAKHRYSEPGELTLHHHPTNSSKSISTQHWKHSSLFSDTPADIRTQVLKPRKEVNRSWTNHFPAKAKIPRRANLPASSLLSAPSTPSEDHQHPHSINALPTSTNLHANTPSSSTHYSPSLLKYLSLSIASNHPLDLCAQENTFDTALGHKSHLSRRRSASMPNLSSTWAPMNMNSSDRFGPTSLPTPPRERPSSLPPYGNGPFLQNLVGPPHGQVDASFNADDSSARNWQLNSNFQGQHGISLFDRQSVAFTPSLHPRQALTQPSNHQDMTGPSVTAMAAVGPQDSRRRLEIKPNYSHEEVKSLMFNFVRQAQTLKVESANLQSLNTAMKKGFESLQQGKADLMQQIQRYERTVAQKDQQIEAMRRQGSSLQHQYKRIWDEHHQLLATIRKENGTGNPSAIAKKIRWNHSPNAVGAASQGDQSSEKASPVYSANGAQLPISRHAFEQAHTGPHRHFQPVSVPCSSEANVINALNRSLCQQGNAAAYHNGANPSQTASIPAYPKASVANASSRALVQPRFAAANPNSENSPHDGSTRWVPSDQPLGATVQTVTTNGQNDQRPTEHVPTECVTIDLTDDSQSPSSSVLQTRQSSVQGGNPPCDLPSGQYPPDQYPIGHVVSSQYPSDPTAQNQMSQSQLPPNRNSQDESLEARQSQKEAFARMTQKSCLWVQGENPFRKGTKTEQQVGLPNSRRPSQSSTEEPVSFAQSPQAGRVAPLPETATGRKTKKKAPEKTKVALDAEAKKERAKAYRKTAAEKKKREKEAAKQSLPNENMPNNAMRAQKQGRRTANGEKRLEQARNPSEEPGSREPQKTLDGRLYQDDAGVQQVLHEESVRQEASDDHDSLFGESEAEGREDAISPDADIFMHDDAAATEQDREAAFAAEIEAEFEADVDAGRMVGFEQGDASSGQTSDPIAPPNSDDGFHDFSEESEEE